MGEVLIFQLHLPLVIINSMQALHALSHLRITFRETQFHINMYCLKHTLGTKHSYQRMFYLYSPVSYGRTADRYPLRTSLQHLIFALL